MTMTMTTMMTTTTTTTKATGERVKQNELAKQQKTLENVMEESDKNSWIYGPEGRSLYCLNLNCRAPPGRFLQPDLSFR